MTDSGFFTTPGTPPIGVAVAPELIHESEGGWSQIYLIDKDGRFRVYKALKPGFRGNIKYETLLRKEYEIGYKMSHPSLCEVYGFTKIDGMGHCIEMEWVDGTSLNHFLQNVKPSRELSERLILQLCDAIGYCHSKQIIHRDIKPENIMITHNGNCLKLIDFGLSDSDSHSVFKSACGTASFAAPEVLNGGSVNELSDIYSLGKVISLFHPAFSRISAKCMRHNPDKRFHDIPSVLAAVKRVKWNKRIVVVAAIAVLVGALSFLFFRPDNGDAGKIFNNQTNTATDSLQAEPAAVDTIQTPKSIPEVQTTQPIQKSTRESTPESPAEYDAAVIDELFKMATQMVDKGQ